MPDPDYFTLAEIRALPDVTELGFGDDAIEEAAAHFTDIVEREVGKSFIPRTFTETKDGDGTAFLRLSRSPTSLTSVTVSGVAVTTSSVAFRHNRLRYVSSYVATGEVWTEGLSNIVVVYVSGAATPPAALKSAVMWATRDRLITQGSQNGIDVRRTSVSNDLGGTIQYVLPGEKRPTGYPELDALIASYKRTTSPLNVA